MRVRFSSHFGLQIYYYLWFGATCGNIMMALMCCVSLKCMLMTEWLLTFKDTGGIILLHWLLVKITVWVQGIYLKLVHEESTLFSSLLTNCLFTTDIERRSQNSYTALCNVIVSHGAPVGGILDFADHTRGNKCKAKCVHDLCTPCGVSHMFIFTLRSQFIQTWWITVILMIGKPQIPPNWRPMLG